MFKKKMPQAREDMLSEAVSCYRLVPALKILIDGKTMLKGSPDLAKIQRAAHKGVIDWLYGMHGDRSGCANMLQEFLQRNQEWIRYVYSDMMQYNELLGGYTHITDTHYMTRMAEEALYFEWDLDTFRLSDLEEFSLIDIGCGPFSHFHNFHNANPGTLKRYCGIDKRDMGAYGLVLEGKFNSEEEKSHNNDCEVAFMKCDVSKDRNKLIDIGLDCEVLFFGEMLHCTADPLNVLAWCIDAMGHVQIVKILELKEDGAGLDICFDFHMRTHSPGHAITADMAMHFAGMLGWQLQCQEASSQHVMYTMTRG